MDILGIFFNRPVYKKDLKSGGYIAYYKNNLSVTGQGITKEEALENLKEDIKLVKQLKERKESESDYKEQRIAHS
jgi:predicted RNase H-like HicB family nuclease